MGLPPRLDSGRQLVERDAVDLRNRVVAYRVALGIEPGALDRRRLLELCRERGRRLEERLRYHRLDEQQLSAAEAPDEGLVEGLSIELSRRPVDPVHTHPRNGLVSWRDVVPRDEAGVRDDGVGPTRDRHDIILVRHVEVEVEM